MTALSLETKAASANPIDLVEEIVQANEWPHDRSCDEEMVVEISGRWCDYRLFFVWQREMSALHFTCGFDLPYDSAIHCRFSSTSKLPALAASQAYKFTFPKYMSIG